MDQDQPQPNQDKPLVEAALPSPTDASAEVNSRREFVSDVGKKLLYVAPIVLTLAASQAQAGSGSAPS